MRKLIGTAVLLLLGAGLLYGALSVHVVKTEKKTIWITKKSLTLKDTYADVRRWKPDDFQEHQALIQRLAEKGHADVVFEQGFKGAFEDLFGGNKR